MENSNVVSVVDARNTKYRDTLSQCLQDAMQAQGWVDVKDKTYTWKDVMATHENVLLDAMHSLYKLRNNHIFMPAALDNLQDLQERSLKRWADNIASEENFTTH